MSSAENNRVIKWLRHEGNWLYVAIFVPVGVVVLVILPIGFLLWWK